MTLLRRGKATWAALGKLYVHVGACAQCRRPTWSGRCEKGRKLAEAAYTIRETEAPR